MKGIGFDGTVSWSSFGARVLVSFVGVGVWQWNVPPTARRIETKHDDDAQSQCVCMIATTSSFILSLICLSRSLRDETRGRKEPALALPKPASQRVSEGVAHKRIERETDGGCEVALSVLLCWF